MKKEVNLVDIAEFSPKLFNILRRNLTRNATSLRENKPFALTISGLKEFGLKRMYDFSEVPEVLDPVKLDVVLMVLERHGVHLSMSEKDISEIDFEILREGKTFEGRLRETLIKHCSLEFEEKILPERKVQNFDERAK